MNQTRRKVLTSIMIFIFDEQINLKMQIFMWEVLFWQKFSSCLTIYQYYRLMKAYLVFLLVLLILSDVREELK